jgi:DNA-binding LacI/PurR family transcriptional regulator
LPPDSQGAPPRRRVRQRDIAVAAGVVQSTVSRILAGNGADRTIPEATRTHVLKIAQEMGYRLDPLAQRMKGKHSHVIGVHTSGDEVPLTADNYNYPYLLGIREATDARGYDLLLFTATTHPSGGSTAFPYGENRLALADGSILMGYRDDHEELARLSAEGYPFVRIDRREVPGVDVAWVDSDHVNGTIEMVTALLDAGYRNLVYVGATQPLEQFADRQRGFAAAVQQHKLKDSTLIRQDHDQLDVEWLRDLRRAHRGRLTFVAERHLFARTLAELSEELQIDAPIAVLQQQWDSNESPLYCAYYQEPKHEIGLHAASLLVDTLEGRASGPRQIVLPGAIAILRSAHQCR